MTALSHRAFTIDLLALLGRGHEPAAQSAAARDTASGVPPAEQPLADGPPATAPEVVSSFLGLRGGPR